MRAITDFLLAITFSLIILVGLYPYDYKKEIDVSQITINRQLSETDKKILIQIGHCDFNGSASCLDRSFVKRTGSSGVDISEPELSLRVALAARDTLLKYGVPSSSIILTGANPSDYSKYKSTNFDYFVSLHFDGSNRKCSTGPSIGYPESKSGYKHIPSMEFGQRWKSAYSKYYPKSLDGWMTDNFTRNLAGYYMFNQIQSDKKLLIEFAELTCPKSSYWALLNADHLGVVLAEFLGNEIATH